MTFPSLLNERFQPEQGLLITVQVPEQRSQRIIDAVLERDSLKYGDYDHVTFKTALGVQQFRSLGTGRNVATEKVVEVPCLELSFFVENIEDRVVDLLTSIYWAHPYEEPVIFIRPCLRTLHIRGTDESNPNRFWNREADDWVPEKHRS